MYCFICPVCGENKFTCDNGRCVDHEDRCNGKADCKDGSDEYGCDNITTSTRKSFFVI